MQVGSPTVVSLHVGVCSEESLFFFSIPLGIWMLPRCAGTVLQECPRCVLNFGPRSFNAWWQREWMLFGFMWNSPPFLFSVPKDRRALLSSRPLCSPPVRTWGRPGARSPRHCQSSCETQWKIGTFVQVFRASVSFKALHNSSCY